MWDEGRIEEEKALRNEFGLKNAREVWSAKTVLRKMRREARRLQSGKGSGIEKRRDQLLVRVQKYFIGKPGITLDDILTLTVRDVLARRLQSLVTAKHMACTPKQARQFIVHGHVKVNDKRVNAPSYLVSFAEEDSVDWWGEPVVVPEKAVLEEDEEAEEKTNEPKAETLKQMTEEKEEAEKPEIEEKEETLAEMADKTNEEPEEKQNQSKEETKDPASAGEGTE